MENDIPPLNHEVEPPTNFRSYPPLFEFDPYTQMIEDHFEEMFDMVTNHVGDVTDMVGIPDRFNPREKL